MDIDTFRRLVKERIKEGDISMRALSAEIGGGESLVRDIVDGTTRHPRIDTVMNLCERLKITWTLGPDMGGAGQNSVPVEPAGPGYGTMAAMAEGVVKGLWEDKALDETLMNATDRDGALTALIVACWRRFLPRARSWTYAEARARGAGFAAAGETAPAHRPVPSPASAGAR